MIEDPQSLDPEGFHVLAAGYEREYVAEMAPRAQVRKLDREQTRRLHASG